MLFNSIPFLLLFVVTYILYWNTTGILRKYILLFSSIIFYGYFGFYVLIHFLVIVYINYYLSNKLFSLKEKNLPTNRLISITVIINVINLSIFKYFYFFMDSIYFITGSQSIQNVSNSVQIFLPLAISFYTFQLIALQVDIHRNRISQRISLLDYYLFILFFPQLIAGPIMRTEDFLPKIDQPEIDENRMYRGIFLILLGLIKKVVIADSISGIVQSVYIGPDKYNAISVFISILGFSAQVYSDFSGYTDMARGLANLLGYEIPENFKGPFLSKSFTELWSRWHVTLSTWLRDYLYISLGGNKKGEFRTSINMLITMSLGGLWHGANIAYFLWGFYLGLALWMERAFGKYVNLPDNIFVNFIRIFLVYSGLSMSGIFFISGNDRYESMSKVIQYLKGLSNFQSGQNLYRLEELVLYILLVFVFNSFQYNTNIFSRFLKYKKVLAIILSIFVLLLMGLFGDGGGDFIYFQF